MLESLKREIRAFKRIAWAKAVPPLIYRMDDRAPALVRANGLQPKGDRTDGAPGQFGPADPNVTIFEHVRKSYDNGAGQCNTVDPWISFFAWHALQPISSDVMAFMQGYMAGYVYMVDTSILMSSGNPLHYANEEFDLARRTDLLSYRGQREWSFKGIVPSFAINSVLTVPALLAALVNGSAPDPQTLPWVALAQA